MTATVRLERIGKSRGIRIPEKMLGRYHFGDELILDETESGITLRSSPRGKLSMEESFKSMTRDKAAIADAKQWAESGLADGLND